MFARHSRRFLNQNRAPGRFEGRKFWRLRGKACFDIRQLVYCSYESFRVGKSRAPDPSVNCPYDRKVPAVWTKFRRCEGLAGEEHPFNGQPTGRTVERIALTTTVRVKMPREDDGARDARQGASGRHAKGESPKRDVNQPPSKP